MHMHTGMRDGMTGRFALVRRDDAKVSILDSAFMLGDGVWEGLRLHNGVLVSAKEHIARLFEGAKAIDMDLNVSPRQLVDMIYAACDANGVCVCVCVCVCVLCVCVRERYAECYANGMYV
jgi:branched-chain amino acid aminotransferase